jgi:hypothetical protein
MASGDPPDSIDLNAEIDENDNDDADEHDDQLPANLENVVVEYDPNNGWEVMSAAPADGHDYDNIAAQYRRLFIERVGAQRAALGIAKVICRKLLGCNGGMGKNLIIIYYSYYHIYLLIH